jgi:hypothetical protein
MPLIIPFGARHAAAAVTHTYTGVTAAQSGGLSTYRFQRGFLSTLTETWAVADATGTLDGVLDWDDYINNVHLWNIVNGTAQLAGPTNITAGGRVVAALPTSDYQVTATLADWHDSGAGVMAFGPCARMQGDTSLTYYVTTLLTVDGVSTVILQRFLNGAQATIGGPVAVTPQVGLTLTTRVRRSKITALVNGVAAFPSVTNTDIPTGTSWGLQGYATVANRVNVASIGASNANVVPLASLFGLRPLTGVY